MKEHQMKNNIVRMLVSYMTDKETREWPPTCLTFVYQPIRPKQTVIDTDNSEKRIKKPVRHQK